jgi:cell division protein FtsN
MSNMKKLAGIFFSLAVIVLLSSCSSKEVTKEDTPKKDTVYVFDQAPQETPKKVETPEVNQQTPIENQKLTGTHYFVQIGAFSTKDKAETFSAAAKQKLNHDMTIRFNEEKQLYVVQLAPPFSSRSEAEKIRDNIKQNQEYSDAWIVTFAGTE